MEQKNEQVSEKVEEEVLEKKDQIASEKELTFLDVLKIFSPGTSIRLALDDILRAGMGALIVVENEKLFDIFEGGFKVNCKFSQQRLVELAKMDGAIILSSDLKKILYANTLLFPDIGIPTKETGTRHKAAERTAKQIKTIVVAVSERKNKTTLYYGDNKYVLEESSEILRRAAETLQILEKQREIFDDLLTNLNVLEINSLVTTSDVCGVLQRLEMVKRISAIVKRYLVELGKEGTIVSMRLKELTKNLDQTKEYVLRDYIGGKYLRATTALDNMSFDFLLGNSNIARIIFDELHEKQITPKGIRILDKTNLLRKNAKSLLAKFKNLDNILDASDEDLFDVLKKTEIVNFFKEELQDLKEKIMSGKKI